ncbi:uncharacterized protein MONOS_2653 [Monocercomonoides exilis]|uniref:uncharacterized protein n=1 Tax=Monocercomonoides exilis TaxID=2049356 RepID=UPI003559BCC9|nr:hypothetical protein MONOS_2653 [Monocercomonoides exilis]|eukprot:MONOS_2653.1-p1 / transcript=MONOS_2653.1 / gene=MONOS_2653 / organism=Monocercomonoides_exilis_PA203 / gene_product=unspecified product / transcript_product=unspecified product / location=Mono_scaffold00056:20311-20844(+) / protein_length=178 / sequence_SO=supercontig / SO=protein_coding / is_pseudo=false
MLPFLPSSSFSTSQSTSSLSSSLLHLAIITHSALSSSSASSVSSTDSTIRKGFTKTVTFGESLPHIEGSPSSLVPSTDNSKPSSSTSFPLPSPPSSFPSHGTYEGASVASSSFLREFPRPPQCPGKKSSLSSSLRFIKKVFQSAVLIASPKAKKKKEKDDFFTFSQANTVSLFFGRK